MRKLLQVTCWLLVFCSSPLFAQRNCATEKLDSIRRTGNPKIETKDAFENWMGNQLLRKSSGANRTQSTYTIPVVVHIIHNGQAVGTGMNISDAQVISQIDVLNEDYQRLNADASQTPSEFQSVAGSLDIQFVLARQDPDGNATTGIVRVNGGRSSWEIYQDAELKAKSYWPAENYFNVWVTDIGDYLGYSTFPVSSLAGVEDASHDRLVDGVVVHYQAFGSSDDGSFDLESRFDLGRTLTHEAGHFFGLRHIWGDVSSCSGNGDYVDDTPFQSSSTSGCPSSPQTSCGHHKMFQNYMDYTDDGCMNLFTVGQFDRAEVVLQNSPRRLSLLISPGASSPGNFALDLGIASATEPTTLECSGSHTPTLTIQNFGTTTITGASIEMKINGSTVQTINPTLNLGNLKQTTVSFSDYTSTAGDSRNFTFTILSVNSVSDEYSGNDVLSVSTKTAANASLPYLETFDTNLNNWDIVNPDDLVTWAQSESLASGEALFIDLYNYDNEGSVDRIYSPLIDISSVSGLLLKFDYAHDYASGYDGDALYVYAQTGCSDDLNNATRIFAKEGSSFSTFSKVGDNDVPDLSTEWKTESISLQNFVGNPFVRLIFVSRNGYGNNVYVDNVQLIGGVFTDLVLQQVLEPSLAVCSESVTPKLLINNEGEEIINGFNVKMYQSGSLIESKSLTDVLDPGEETVVTLSSINLNSGENDFSFSVSLNSGTDYVPSNDEIDWPVTKISKTQTIPVRENFTNPAWIFVSGSSVYWSSQTTNYEKSAIFNAFSSSFDEVGATAMIVSPQLDFTRALEASLFVDFSYAVNAPHDESISIKVSENCGETFANIKFDALASSLTTTENSSGWLPTDADDWTRQYVNLDEFIGQDDIVVAIEVTNDNGNNLYVDNIEFFENDNSSPTQITELFRVYSDESFTHTYLTFNLEEKQPSEVIVANMMGASIANISVDNALNQTLTFQLDVVPGIYIFRVLVDGKWYAVKQYIGY